MIWLILLSLVLYQVGDGVCQRELGESCRNSIDCSVCLVSLDVGENITEPYAIYTYNITNKEPEYIRYTLKVLLNGKEYDKIELELGANQSYSGKVRVKMGRNLQKLEIRAYDDMGNIVAYKEIDVPSLEAPEEGFSLIPAFLAGALVISSLIYAVKLLSTKKEEKRSPYFYAPPVPVPVAVQPQLGVVVKKKVYYYVPRRK